MQRGRRERAAPAAGDDGPGPARRPYALIGAGALASMAWPARPSTWTLTTNQAALDPAAWAGLASDSHVQSTCAERRGDPLAASSGSNARRAGDRRRVGRSEWQTEAIERSHPVVVATSSCRSWSGRSDTPQAVCRRIPDRWDIEQLLAGDDRPALTTRSNHASARFRRKRIRLEADRRPSVTAARYPPIPYPRSSIRPLTDRAACRGS